jgi:hypothetical protein
MRSVVDELWSVARDSVHVNAEALARALENVAADRAGELDYRTRLLVRDGVAALRAHWGDARFSAWIHHSAQRQHLEVVCQSPPMRMALSDEGFPTLARRLVNPIDPATVLQLLRELSTHVTQPTQLVIGGSIAVMLAGHLSRSTDDIDVVDELPASLRAQPTLLEGLAQRYGLRLAHFQSHYLPGGWDQRIWSVDTFGKLQVLAVDPYDVVVGKMFSIREKDRDDLRAITPRLDRAVVEDRVRRTTADLRSEQRLLDAARRNWFILFGQELPI